MLFSSFVYKWLDNSLDYGITEQEFWNMTLAELERLIKSKRRIMENEAKQRATFDYVLADLIGRSISRIYHSNNKIPPIAEVYPTLFDSADIEEKKQAKKDELSALRFKQFADTFNKRFKEASVKE